MFWLHNFKIEGASLVLDSRAVYCSEVQNISIFSRVKSCWCLKIIAYVIITQRKSAISLWKFYQWNFIEQLRYSPVSMCLVCTRHKTWSMRNANLFAKIKYTKYQIAQVIIVWYEISKLRNHSVISSTSVDWCFLNFNILYSSE